MNEHVKPPTDLPPSTARRLITVDEFERMAIAGVFAEDERIELIEGEILTMAPKGRYHEIVKIRLLKHWTRMSSDSILIAPETPISITGVSQPEPDLTVLPDAVEAPDAAPGDVLLFVEISDSSEGYDLSIKAPLYARAGIREYWVINARSLDVRVFRDPSPTGYETMFKVPAGEVATPLLVPELAIRLTDVATPAPE